MNDERKKPLGVVLTELIGHAAADAPDCYCTVILLPKERGPAAGVTVGTTLENEAHMRAVLGEVVASSLHNAGHCTEADMVDAAHADARVAQDLAGGKRPRAKA